MSSTDENRSDARSGRAPPRAHSAILPTSYCNVSARSTLEAKVRILPPRKAKY
jgi:hypothetical protein